MSAVRKVRIYFSQVDNMLGENGEPGWAGSFIRFFEFYCNSLSAISLELSFHTDDDFGKGELVEKADVILLILSPAFFLVDETPTLLEKITSMQEYRKVSLLVNVHRAPFKDGGKLIEGLNGIDFYFFEGKEDSSENYFEHKFSNETNVDSQYWVLLRSIVHTISKRFTTREFFSEIYLGQFPGQSNAREYLKNELDRLTYKIVPETVKTKLVFGGGLASPKQFEGYIKVSSAIILFPGEIQNDEDFEGMVKEIDLSIKYDKHMILWFGEKFVEREESKFTRMFLRTLRDYKNHDIFVGTKEEFANFCKQHLNEGFYKSFQQERVREVKSSGEYVVNLISTKEHDHFYHTFKEALLGKGITVDERLDSDFMDFASYQEQMIRANALIIYYQKQSFNWILANMMEAKKIIGYRNGKPLDVIAIVTNNLESIKDIISTFDVVVVSEQPSTVVPVVSVEKFSQKYLPN